MIKKMGKRGMSHVEVILSFVIFVGFLIFLIAIFNPFKSSEGGEVYLDILEREIIGYTSVEVKFITLKLLNKISDCFCLEYDFDNLNIIVKNESQDFREARTGLLKEMCINDGGSFFYVQACEDFKEAGFLGSCTRLEENKNYTLGLFRSYKMVSNITLTELHKSLIEDYETMKEEFGISPSQEFSISVRETEEPENIILDVTKEAPKKVKVLARDVSIQIIYKDGKIKYARLNIRVW